MVTNVPDGAYLRLLSGHGCFGVLHLGTGELHKLRGPVTVLWKDRWALAQPLDASPNYFLADAMAYAYHSVEEDGDKRRLLPSTVL